MKVYEIVIGISNSSAQLSSMWVSLDDSVPKKAKVDLSVIKEMATDKGCSSLIYIDCVETGGIINGGLKQKIIAFGRVEGAFPSKKCMGIKRA